MKDCPKPALPVIAAPTFSPFRDLGFPLTAPAASLTDAANYRRSPLVTRLSWQTNALGNGTAFKQDLTIGEPSLVRLRTITPTFSTTQQCWLDACWVPFGTRAASAVFLGDDTASERQQFVGPYAFLPKAGRYSLVAVTDFSAAAALTLHADLIQGIPLDTIVSLLSSDSPRFVEAHPIVPAGGVTIPLITAYHSSFFLFRQVRIQNTGAAVAVINFGSVVAGYSRYTLAAGAEVTFTERELGRHTLTVVSGGAGTTLNVWASLW